MSLPARWRPVRRADACVSTERSWGHRVWSRAGRRTASSAVSDPLLLGGGGDELGSAAGQMPQGPCRDAPRRAGRSPRPHVLGLRRSGFWKLAPRRRGAWLAGNLEPPAPGHGGLQVGFAPVERTGRRPRQGTVSSPWPHSWKGAVPVVTGLGRLLPTEFGVRPSVRGALGSVTLSERSKMSFRVCGIDLRPRWS